LIYINRRGNRLALMPEPKDPIQNKRGVLKAGDILALTTLAAVIDRRG